MKYFVTLTLRKPDKYMRYFFRTRYGEFSNLRELNSFLYDNICNTPDSEEIVGFMLESTDD